MPAPKLLLRAEQEADAVEVPLADLVWRLHLPSGYEVVASGGTVATDDIKRPCPAAVEIAQFLLDRNRRTLAIRSIGICIYRAARRARKKRYSQQST